MLGGHSRVSYQKAFGDTLTARVCERRHAGHARLGCADATRTARPIVAFARPPEDAHSAVVDVRGRAPRPVDDQRRRDGRPDFLCQPARTTRATPRPAEAGDDALGDSGCSPARQASPQCPSCEQRLPGSSGQCQTQALAASGQRFTERDAARAGSQAASILAALGRGGRRRDRWLRGASTWHVIKGSCLTDRRPNLMVLRPRDYAELRRGSEGACAT